MADFISREAAIKRLYIAPVKTDADGYSWVLLRDAFRAVDDVPAEDVRPVVKGKWVWDDDGMDWNIGAWRCSVCGAMSPMWWNCEKTNPRTKSGHRFCPNCGADMREAEP